MVSEGSARAVGGGEGGIEGHGKEESREREEERKRTNQCIVNGKYPACTSESFANASSFFLMSNISFFSSATSSAVTPSGFCSFVRREAVREALEAARRV